MISCVLAILICITVLAGCSGNQQQPSQAPSGQPSQAPSQAPSGQPSQQPPAGSNKEKIKLGFIASLTGSPASSGMEMRDGFLLYLEERNYILGGHEIEVFVEDDTADPSTAVQKATKLVEQDEVSMLIGPVLAPAAYAISGYSTPNEIPFMLPVPSGDAMTQHDFSDYVMRVGYTSSQVMFPLADYAYNVLGYRRVAAFALDNAFGHESIGGFQYEFERLGGVLTTKIWQPMNATDISPLISQIPLDVDAVVITQAGANAINFYQAYSEFGIPLPVIGSGSSTDESTLAATGDACIGSITALHYSAAIDTPENKAFLEAFTGFYGRSPSYFADTGYAAATVLDKIFDLMDEGFDTGLLLSEFKKFKGTFPRGYVEIDDFNHPIQNVYIRKVEKVNGALQNTIIKTYENVSQFWTYGAAAVLARPVFTKDYPPLKG